MDERQMSFFEDGGMTAPEVEQDPVSGNEVPPGSLPEEVRDDVDAQLSGGEYVVPADVLRYYGMKFFEDLRKQAKEELGQMDSEGRIGGETEMEGGELSPEEMAMLQEAMAESEPQFNQGGMVLQNPEFYGQPQYNEGGMQPVQRFNPDQWRDVGSSYFGSQGSGEGISVGSYYKTYIGPNGETQLILFVDGKPTTPIPEGFKPREEAVDQQQEEQAKEEIEIDEDWNDRRQEQRQQEAKSWGERNYEAVTEDPVAFGLEQLKGDGGLFGTVAKALGGGAIGGAVGAAMELEDIASAKAAQQYAKAKGIDTGPLDTAIEQAENNLGFASKALMKTDMIATGDNYYEGLEDYINSLGTTPSQTEAVFKSVRGDYSDRTPEETASRLQQLGQDDDRFAGQKVTTKENTLTGGTTSSITSKDGDIEVNRNDKTTIDPSQKERTRPQARPRANKGGLMVNRKKQKK